VTDHLSDFQILLLATGEGSASARQRLSDHLTDCELCCRRLADAVAETGEETIEVGDAAAGHEAFIADTVSTVMATFRRRGEKTREDLRRLVLFPSSPQSDAALAAKGPDGTLPAPFPSLISEDGTILIRFRKPTPESPFRAYVIQDRPGEKRALAIRFPGREEAFPVSPEGEVDLVGVTADELAGGRLEIELRPSAPDEPEDSDS